VPIYEYHCAACDRRFELLTTISKADQASCLECGSADVKRLVSAFAARVSSGNGHSHSVGGGECASCAAGHCSSCGCH
jgi:putative FmdB family regulatory protein